MMRQAIFAFFWVAFALCRSAAAAVTGDLNGDGAVDIADALRVEEMLAGNLAVEALADVDGDGAVTATDSWLIHEAALGAVLPQLLGAATIGPAGGEVAGGGARLVVPAGAIADSAAIAMLRDTTGLGLDDGQAEGEVLLLTGLPRGASGIAVRLPLPDTGAADDWTLMGGEYFNARSSEAYAWHWRPLGRDVVTQDGNELVYVLPPLPLEPDEGGRDNPLAGKPSFTMLKFAVCANPAAGGGRATRYFNRIYTSAHFKVYAPDQASEELILATQNLTDKLETVYNLTKGLGFPLDSQSGWFPLEVYVKNGLNENGLFVDSTIYGKYISVRAGLLAAGNVAELKATLAHEFLHFVQSFYGASIDTSGWADDATAVWFEKAASGDPNYIPNVFVPPAPISGMHRTVEREFKWTINPREVYNWQDSWNRAQGHGYSMSAFFEYLSKRYDWNPQFVYLFYQRIQAGSTPVKALDEVLTSTTGNDLDTIFDFFCADYLQAKHPYLAANPRASTIFDEAGKRGVRHIITQTTEDPFELFEDTLTVQELGAGMVQFKVVEPQKIFPEGTVLYAEVEAEHCDRLYGIVEYKTDKEFVAGTYDSVEKKYTLELPMNVESNQVMLHLLVYKDEESVGDGDADTFQIQVKSGFKGRFFIPPHLAYHRINGKPKHEMFASAIFDMEPGRLEKFTVHDYRLSFSDYDYTYTIFSKWAQAVRKDTSSFPITLFGDVSVRTIEPFFIEVTYPDSLAPGGFSTFDWSHHDVPVPSLSGSPTLAVMAYHGPGDGSISLSLEPHRIFNQDIPQEQLKEANGGIEVIVPSAIDGYIYILAVFGKYTEGGTGSPSAELIYFLEISPPVQAVGEVR